LREVRINVEMPHPFVQVRCLRTKSSGAEKLQDAIMTVAGCFKEVQKVELETQTAWKGEQKFTNILLERCREKIELGQW